MKDYNKIESCLKSFLKNNKRLSYSIALLITFLINGGFSYADEAVQVPLRTEIKTRIEKEQENISQMLKEADESMKGIELKIKKLIQRGEFWVKPLEKSYQGFIFANWGNYSKNKNKTESNFNGPEYSASYGRNMGYGQFSNGKYYGEYGIVKNPLEFVDKIDFGANITPKAVIEKTIVEKTVTQKTIVAPSVVPPTVTVAEIVAPEVSTPEIADMVEPGEVNINVSAPGTVPALSAITVAAVTALNVNPTPPEVGEAPTVMAPTVTPPATPAGFTPAVIPLPKPPKDPDKPDISVFNPIDLAFNGTGFGQGAQSRVPKGDTIIENFGDYVTGNGGADTLKISSDGTGTKWSGTNLVASGTSPSGGLGNATLTPGSTGTGLAAFFSDAANHSVTIRGNYDMTRPTDTGNGTIMFSSLNPYYVADSDKTYDFQGNLTLHGHDDPSSNNLLLGFEHQLLTYVKSNTINGTSIFKNSGNITLQDGYNIVGIQIDTEYNSANSEFTKQPQTINAGKIVINSKRSIGIDYGYYYDHAPNTKLHIGNIEVNGEGNYGLRMKNYYTKNANYYDKTNVTGSNGVITLGGKKNVGIYVGQGMSSGDPIGNMDNLQVKVGGENNIGFLRAGTTGVNANSITLDASKLGTIFTFDESGTTKKSALVRSDFGEVILDKSYTWNSGNLGEGNTFLQAGKTGIVNFKSGNTLTVKANKFYGMTAGNFEEGKNTSGAKAINNAKIDITGNSSVAMAADIGNIIENKGELKVTGKGVTGIYNLGTFAQVGANSKLEVSGEKTLGLYNKAGTMTLDGTATINGTKGSIGLFSDGGTVTSNMGDKLSINSDDTGLASGASQGLGVYSANGANVKINGAKINVTGGSVAIAAVGKNAANVGSHIEAKNSTINYSGEGYAVYTADKGSIDISNSTINLSGKATGMEINKAVSNQITATNAKIHVKSNNVTVFNLTNVTTPLSLNTLEASLKAESGISSITADAGIDKYKLASLDGGALNVDTPISRTDAVGTPGYTFYRRFLAQRTKLNVTKNVTAIMNSTEAKDYNGQVVGLEMNSSKNASSVSETAINLKNGAKIIADRTDAGAGAIGAFINYGEVNIDATSKIEVEKESNEVNKQAVGVYAVNGSKVDNKGTIDVGGDQSVGILGMAYREKGHNTPIVNEFGGKSGEGTINITNEKDIKMLGKDAIGIYAMNNNLDKTVTSHLVINKGTVEVGDSAEKTAVGIYAKEVNVKPEGGKIKIGKKAVGIYAENSNVGETGKDLGTIDFNGDNGVGIYLKGGLSNLDGNKVTLSESGTSKNKVGILADRETNSIIKTEVVVGTLNNVIAYYSKGNNELNVQSNLTLNEDSIGMSGEGDLLYGNNSSTHTMKLGKGSTGIFGNKNITLTDKTTIELNGNSSVGVFAKGASGIISSNGNIKFTKENSIGLYGANGATVNDKTASMDFSNANAKNNIGAYLAGAKWVDSRTGAYTFNSDHSKNNIYLFAQGGTDGTTDFGSTATLKNEFKVNPTGTASSTAKTIGMYFNTAVKGKSTFVDNTLDMADNNAKISVTNSGIGVYAKNTDSSKNNIINKIKVSSVGQGTVGVFTDGNLKLDRADGLIEAKNTGIGLYGNSGKVTVENKHKVEVTSSGTGMYMTNGSYLEGGELELKNNTAGTSAAGIYYTKGTNNNEVNHGTDLTINSGSSLLALYVDGGIKLNNAKTIKIGDGENNVGAFVTGNSIFKNKGKISLTDSIKNAIGVYVEDGEATNEAGKDIEILDLNTSGTGTPSIGMTAKAASGKTAKVINKGTINAKGEAIGMNVEDNSEGENTGTIESKNWSVAGSTFKSIGEHI